MSDNHAQAGHNVGGVDKGRLLSIVERHERLEEEVKALRSDQSDIMKEAKSAGFDVKILRQVIRLRKLEDNDRQEQDHLMDLYRRALGV